MNSIGCPLRVTLSVGRNRESSHARALKRSAESDSNPTGDNTFAERHGSAGARSVGGMGGLFRPIAQARSGEVDEKRLQPRSPAG